MKFSIITPTYNRALTIERAVESILNQSYQNFEMIIIDDGSTDSTLDILKKYSNDSRIRVIKSISNAGVNVARNIGLKNVANDSDWITFLDSDDEFTFDALQNMILTVEANPMINYFRFPVKYIDGSIVSNMKLASTIADYKMYLSQISDCGEWVVTINREIVLKGFFYDERVKAHESLSWIALSKKEKLFYGKSIVRIYNLDVDGITRQKEKSLKFYENAIEGSNIMLDEYGDDLKKYNIKVYASILFALANYNLIIGNTKLGLNQTSKAMKIDFFNLRILRNLKSLILNR
ncbi:GalNAc5-diNAcBac-PP-undecaprenol beta-1,3-glucosyltransferase [Flavobacterium tiangeerense]|uniref:GalNAc5-diNAcBac-PP-undecaprenol beta-1,3-glucosyltransferase n=1 Tax=Flavobacterium tiangeerense TaxID=459471 RepID=A0ABY3FKB8_9FLAO|nr:glycosyltransferase family 2 protein [Flavobacterium tiangeerense]TWH99145.1 GalNAc5-diNAcBac-PP-undecaprenol beta-1,3-glucosyltransferase [Flavobacterium tiangeerense]